MKLNGLVDFHALVIPYYTDASFIEGSERHESKWAAVDGPVVKAKDQSRTHIRVGDEFVGTNISAKRYPPAQIGLPKASLAPIRELQKFDGVAIENAAKRWHRRWMAVPAITSDPQESNLEYFVRCRAMKGWSPINDDVIPTIDQSCMRDFFGKDFPRFSPSTSKSHRGFNNPDRVDSPIEIMKRFSTELRDVPTPYEDYISLGVATSLSWQCAPWAYYSGSLAKKVYAAGNDFPGTGMLITTRLHSEDPGGITNATMLDMANGTVVTDLSKNGFHSYAVPFDYPWFAVEFETVNGDPAVFNYFYTQYRGRGTATIPVAGAMQVDTCIAVGDDWALYHFCACPYLGVVGSLPKVKRATSRSRSAKRAPPSDDESSEEESY
jgi:hypothetical protein